MADQIPVKAIKDPITGLVTGLGEYESGDTISKAVVGLGNVTNDAQAKASIYPNTVPAAGRILVGQTTGKYESHAMSGDATISESGLLTLSNGAVTNAKQGHMAAGTIKGNKYAANVVPQDLTPAEARSVLGLGTAAVVNTGTGSGDAILGNDTRLSDSREWTAATVDQAEAEAGTATTRRAWTAERVRQAIAAWWSSVKGALVGPVGISGNLTVNGAVVSTSSLGYGAGLTARSLTTGADSWARLDISHKGVIGPAILYQTVSGYFGIRNDSATPIIALEHAGIPKLIVDVSGDVLVTSPALLGYGPGSGGTVVQSTSKSTTVTLNKPTGQITMNNASLSAGASVAFVLNNSLIGASDVVFANASSSPNYRVEVQNTFAGTTSFRVTNITGGSLSDALVINFAIIKGALA